MTGITGREYIYGIAQDKNGAPYLFNIGEIVRCKDCRYCTEYYDRDGYPYWICDEWDGGTDADGFCHYGERKGGDSE